MSFSFCFSSIAVINSLSLVINFGLETGGPVVMIWGWLIASFFTICTVLSMAEICSIHPSAGSVYYLAGRLSKRENAPLISYICGWFNLMGNVAGNSSFAYVMCQIISACVQLVQGQEQRLSTEMTVLVSIFVLLLWAIKKRIRLEKQGWFSNTSAIYQMVSTVMICFIILIFSPKLSDHDFVFTKFNNQTGFEDSYSVYICLTGILMSIFGLSGYESRAPVSEETVNASIYAPQGMVNAAIASVVTGFIFILGLLYASKNDIARVLNGPTDQAVLNIFSMTFYQSNQIWALLVLAIVLSLNIFLAGFRVMTVTTRITYALAKDGALPKSEWLSKLNEKTANPDRILMLVFVVSSTLCLLPLISTTAFIAIT